MTRRADKDDGRHPVQLSDPRAIRALAHPARLAVIDELYGGRELTATECAEIAGLSPSAMSYHLRSLEKAGIVERAASGKDGRQRPWRSAGAYLDVDSGVSTSGLAASAALTTSVLGRMTEQFSSWLGRRADEDPIWVHAAGATSGQVWLLPEEVERIERSVLALVDEYRGRVATTRPDGARRVRVGLFLFPVDKPDTPSR